MYIACLVACVWNKETDDDVIMNGEWVILRNWKEKLVKWFNPYPANVENMVSS